MTDRCTLIFQAPLLQPAAPVPDTPKSRDVSASNPLLSQIQAPVVRTLSRIPYIRNIANYRTDELWNWQTALTVILWFIFWGLFIELEFGAVFFIISGFVFMYKCTRTRPREAGEASAYSVFNPGCERLDGTFTPEQFERQLGLGLANSPT